MRVIKNMNVLFLLGLLVLSTLTFVEAHKGHKETKGEVKQSQDEEEKEEEKPLPKLKTVDQCKGDCTIEWQDCVTLCGNNGPQHCYVNCQKSVKKCLDECPNVICHDHCSIELEVCQRANKNPASCEAAYNNCQEDCDNAYIGRTDL